MLSALTKSLLFICIGILKLSYLYSQEKINLETTRNKFLPEIEFFGEPSFLFPRIDSAYWGINYEKKTGYMVGVGLLLPVTNFFDIGIRFAHQRKGLKGSFGPSSSKNGEIFDINNDYSTISILPQFLIGKKNKLSIGLGGYFSYLIRSKINLIRIEGDPSPDQLRLQTDQFNRFDAGFSCSIGYRMPLRQNMFLNIQLLNNYGMRNILNSERQPYNDEVLSFFNSATVKNNNVSLMVGLSGLLDKPKFKVARNTVPNQPISNHFFSKIELMAGPSISFLRGNAGVETTTLVKRKIKTGYTYGLGLVHKVDERYNIEVQFLFERKGGTSESITMYFDSSTQSLKQGKTTSEYSYDYFTLPIFVDYNFGRKRRFNIGLGLFTSYLQKQIVTEKFPFFGTIQTKDETDLNKKIDFGLAYKMGYLLPLRSNLDLSFQLLNTRGIFNTRLNIYPGQVMNSNNTALLVGIILKR